MSTRWITQLPNRLSRITSSGKYISEVDGLRFMAIVPVLIQHLSERLQRNATTAWSIPTDQDAVVFWASRGTVGVFIFFAISGFILGLPFAKYYLQGSKKVGLKAYFWRRITRLEPPYMFWMTVFFVALLLKGGSSFSELWPHWGASLGYIHNVVYRDYSAINPVAWSLEIEIQFYILAPLLAWGAFRWPSKWLRRTIIGAGIVAVLWAQHFFGWVELPWKLTLLWQLQYFLVGFLLAEIYLTEWRHKEAGTGQLALDGVAILSLAGMGLTWSADVEKRLLFVVFLLLFLIAGFRGRWFTKFLRYTWVAAIGGMCYTIYLIHLPLLEAVVPFTAHWGVGSHFGVNLLWQMLLVFPIVLAVSVVGFLWLEKPCMDPLWPQKLRAWLKGNRNQSSMVKPISQKEYEHS
ncbi:MAG: acyltransferase [Saprospiraceae bacterium]